MIAGLTYNFLPFMVLPLYASLDKIDPRLIEAASDLYANPFVGFRKVTWPLSLPGVVAGTLLTFIPAAGDYINAELLGTPNQYMIGNVIQSLFTDANDYPAAGALSMILMVADRGDGARLRPPGRDGGAAVMRALDAGSREHAACSIARRCWCCVYTFLPIVVVVADELQRAGQPADLPSSTAFTLDNWLQPVRRPEHVRGRWCRSIEIGLLATLVATVLGTLMAFALVRHRFRGRGRRPTC